MDLLLSTLRHVDGVPLKALHSRTQHTLDPSVIHALSGRHLIDARDDYIRLTPAAYPVADGVVRRMADALVPFA